MRPVDVTATSAVGAEAPTAAAAHVDLAVGGMTCAACASRIEKRLNKLEGVTAAVNFATETAAVDYDPARIAPEAVIATVEGLGYSAAVPDPGVEVDEREESAALRNYRRRFLLAAPLTIPVVALGMRHGFDIHHIGHMEHLPAHMHGPNGEELPGMGGARRISTTRAVELGLTAPVVLWAGLPFHRVAWMNLRHRTATMDTLVSLGTLSAFLWSVWAVLAGREEIYLEVAAAVTTFLLLGRWLEARSRRRAGGALRELMSLGAKEVSILRPDGTEERVDVTTLRPGHLFVVRPGEKIATDGIVEQGVSALDLSMITGESVPVERGPGDEVVGASLNVNGRLVVRATRVGSQTALAQIARLVAGAQSGKAPVQRLADRVAGIFVPVVICIALVTLAAWLALTGDVDRSFTATVAVLIIACPCALGLATPTALLVGTGRGAQLGLLIKGPEVLESTRKVDTIVLDKTGTVTSGKMTVHGMAVEGADGYAALRLVGALEQGSEHPIGRAVAQHAATRVARASDQLPRVEHFTNVEGLGVVGVVDGIEIVVGRPALLERYGLVISEALERSRADSASLGRTAILAGWDGQARVLVSVGDTIKENSRAAIAALRELGLRPYLVTGDSEATALAVAREVGISAEHVIAEVLPADKVEVIRRLRTENRAARLRGRRRVVAMVGDGVNDAGALAEADLGLSMGTGTDVAIEASDLTLVRGDLAAAPDAIRLARRTLGTIRGNLFWAFAYNVAAIPLAALGLLNPMIAGGAMAMSSLFVVSNSLRLRRFKPS